MHKVPRGKIERETALRIEKILNLKYNLSIFCLKCTFCIMGSQVNFFSKQSVVAQIYDNIKVNKITPEVKRSNQDKGELILCIMEACTYICCKILGIIVVRSERLIKLEDSWFSTKIMFVIHHLFTKC